MSIEYAISSLTDDAKQYVIQSLQNGTRLFAGLASQLNSKAGKAITFLPRDHGRVIIGHFDVGGVASSRTARLVLAEYLRQTYPRSTLVVENRLAKPSDPVLQRYHSDVRVVKGEVFHYSSCDDLQSLETVLRESSPRAAGLVVDPFFNTQPGDFLQLSTHMCQAIICDAYDEESYIMWEFRV